MWIERILDEPLFELPCVSAAPGGRGVWRWNLPVLCAITPSLPPDLDAVLVTADLQAVDRDDVPVQLRRLMGEVLAEAMIDWCGVGLLPPADRVGVILAGDLYTTPTVDKRGGSGDVQGQWDAFGRALRWVAGVAGNHDTFGGGCTPDAFRRRPGDKHLLDGDPAVVNLDGLRLGGLSGVVGHKGKPWRRPLRDAERALRAVLAAAPDIVVLHEGPGAPGLPGNDHLRRAIDASPAASPPLVVCGHCHWPTPLALTQGGAQVLNVDGRAVLLTREVPSWCAPPAPQAAR